MSTQTVKKITPDLAGKITDAAEQCLPFDGIGAAIGLSPDVWLAVVRAEPDEVALAISLGRAKAQAKNGTDLLTCVNHGKTDAALYALRAFHGWPAPKRGRPARPKQR
jgi:hypothetical protein